MNKCGLGRKGEKAVQSRPVLVLAIFTQQLVFSVFLTLQVASRQLNAERFEIGDKLSWGLELDAAQAKTLCGFDVGRNVINVKGFVGANFEAAQGLLIYEGIGLAGSDGAGIDANGEEFEKAVVVFEVANVDRVGIREKSEAVTLGKALDKRILLDGDWVKGAIPDFGELFEGKFRTKALIQVKIPVAGRHAAFLPVGPAGILFDGGPKLGGG